MAKVRFRNRWFNPLYFIINRLVKLEKVRTILIFGGKSSAKTVSICQFLSKESVVNKASSLAYRKESASVPTTLKKSFNLAIDKLYLYPAFDMLDRKYVVRDSGAEIVLKGIDKDEKAKGIESYKYLFLDELNQFDQSEYDQFQLSLRGMPGQIVFGAWNPVDVNSWVKTELIDKTKFIDHPEYKLPSETSYVKISEDGSTVLIKTVYQDNYWINGSPDSAYGYRDEKLIAEYNRLKTKNNRSYKVNVLGEWGKVTYGGEFLKKFKGDVHVGTYPYNPDLAIYLSLDENVNPYFPCGFFQVADNQKDFYLIDELALENPDNTTGKMGLEIKKKLRRWRHDGRLYVGGDSTSQKEDVKQEKGVDLFQLVINELKEFKPIRRVSTSNPNVRGSGDFFNDILEYNEEGLVFHVDEKCRVAIMDYENTKEDKNGKIDKTTVIHPRTKVSYQPWGHFVDLTRYFICNTFNKEYLHYQTKAKEHQMSGGKYERKSF